MKRRIIKINAELCTGCGACAEACHEGAIGMKNGKAVLLRDDYCDGLGDCLPHCPTDAISFEVREAVAYDEAAVKAHIQKQKDEACISAHTSEPIMSAAIESQLAQWPCQIKLVSVYAPFFEGASLLIAADCTAYAYANMHREFMAEKITLIGCPKLDAIDYSEKLGVIFSNHQIRNVTLVRMEVPCCGGMERAVRTALQSRPMPFRVVVISRDGRVLSQRSEL